MQETGLTTKSTSPPTEVISDLLHPQTAIPTSVEEALIGSPIAILGEAEAAVHLDAIRLNQIGHVFATVRGKIEDGARSEVTPAIHFLLKVIGESLLSILFRYKDHLEASIRTERDSRIVGLTTFWDKNVRKNRKTISRIEEITDRIEKEIQQLRDTIRESFELDNLPEDVEAAIEALDIIEELKIAKEAFAWYVKSRPSASSVILQSQITLNALVDRLSHLDSKLPDIDLQTICRALKTAPLDLEKKDEVLRRHIKDMYTKIAGETTMTDQTLKRAIAHLKHLIDSYKRSQMAELLFGTKDSSESET